MRSGGRGRRDSARGRCGVAVIWVGNMAENRSIARLYRTLKKCSIRDRGRPASPSRDAKPPAPLQDTYWNTVYCAHNKVFRASLSRTAVVGSDGFWLPQTDGL